MNWVTHRGPRRFTSPIIMLLLGLFSIGGVGCENRAKIESTTDSIVEVVANPAIKYGWTAAGLADSYLIHGMKIAKGELTIWNLGALTVVAGPIEQTIQPFMLTPSINPTSSSILWDLRFRQIEFVVPVRVRSDQGIFLCRFKMTSPSLDLETVVTLAPRAPHSGNYFKQAGIPTISGTSWTLRALGECPTSIFPSTFDYESALKTYLNDAFLTSTGEHFEAFPEDPFGLLEKSLKVSSLSSYESRRGSMYVIPDTNNLKVDLLNNGVEISLPIKLGNQRALCAPVTPLKSATPFPPSGTLHPIDIALNNGVEFGVAFDATFLSYLLAAYTRTGLVCAGFESSEPILYDYSAIATESLDLPQIGFTGLPFGENSTLTFRPITFPKILFRPAAKQFSLLFEHASIDLYTELFGVYTRLATYNFKLQFDLQLNVRQKLINQDIIRIDVTNATAFRSMGPTIPTDTLNQWIRRAFVLLTQKGQLPYAFLNSTPYKWKAVLLNANSLSLAGSL